MFIDSLPPIGHDEMFAFAQFLFAAKIGTNGTKCIELAPRPYINICS